MQVTTARKAVTLLLSYLIFTKPLTEQHVTGLLLITMGIIMKMLPDSKIPSWSAVSSAVKLGISELKKPLKDEEDEGKVALI